MTASPPQPGHSFSFERLRRHPDVEAPNLFAVDASDRLLLDEASELFQTAEPDEVVVIGDHYGALTLGAAALHGVRGLRVHQDPLTNELALAANASATGLAGCYESLPLSPALVAGARVLLLQLPRAVAALAEITALVAEYAALDVTVVAGGRVKHMTPAMNAVLGRHFADVRATRARQKSRAVIARTPYRVAESGSQQPSSIWPQVRRHPDLALVVCAHGAVFAGTGIDIGTRYLLGFLPRMAPMATQAIDLGCGSGVLAAALALARPDMQVIATDQSAGAVASARATMAANLLTDRVRVTRSDAGADLPPGSADLVLLNPPFHVGSTVHTGAASGLFAGAARLLRPGGQLWTVFNSHLHYRSELQRVIGPTEQVGRNAKFTVTVSTRRP